MPCLLALPATATAQSADTAVAPVSARAGASGFRLVAADSSFMLRLRGAVQLDARAFAGDGDERYSDEFLLRRVRADVLGTVHRRFDFRLQVELAPFELLDAYSDVQLGGGTGLRLGKMKTPVGMERLQRPFFVTFAELGFPTQLVPNRDVGAMLHGDLGGDRLSWAAMISDGAPDGESTDRDTGDGKDLSGRIFVHPFRGGVAQGLGLGISATTGSQDGRFEQPLLAAPTTAGEAPVLVYRNTASGAAVANGPRTRVSPQGNFYWRGLGLQGEYVRSSTETVYFADHARLVNTAWQGTASLVLTGEPAGPAGIEPARPFDPAHGGWGAWEVGVRMEGLEVDPATFPRFADPALGYRGARAWTAGVNGYLNSNVRVVANYVRTRFRAAPGGAERPDEQLVVTRFQLMF